MWLYGGFKMYPGCVDKCWPRRWQISLRFLKGGLKYPFVSIYISHLRCCECCSCHCCFHQLTQCIECNITICPNSYNNSHTRNKQVQKLENDFSFFFMIIFDRGFETTRWNDPSINQLTSQSRKKKGKKKNKNKKVELFKTLKHILSASSGLCWCGLKILTK